MLTRLSNKMVMNQGINNFYKKYKFANVSFKLVYEILGNLDLFQNKDDHIIIYNFSATIEIAIVNKK